MTSPDGISAYTFSLPVLQGYLLEERWYPLKIRHKHRIFLPSGYMYCFLRGNIWLVLHIRIPLFRIPVFFSDRQSELAGFEDTFWNSERLANYTTLGKLNSSIIATALAELNHVI